MSVVFGALYDVLKSNKALVGLTNRLHTTVIELQLKWNGHHFVAVTNINFSNLFEREKVEFSGALPRNSHVFEKPILLS
jgi:hypothetical protein